MRLAPAVAFQAAIIGAWIKAADQEEMLGKVWRRVAYATRYGKAGLNEALSMPQEDLAWFCQAVGEIVDEENRAARGKGA